MKKLFGFALIALALTGCTAEVASFEAKTTEACVKQGGEVVEVSTGNTVESLTCNRSDGTVTKYHSSFGMYLVDNDATGTKEECTLQMKQLVKNEQGEFICGPRLNPKTFTKFYN